MLQTLPCCRATIRPIVLVAKTFATTRVHSFLDCLNTSSRSLQGKRTRKTPACQPTSTCRSVLRLPQEPLDVCPHSSRVHFATPSSVLARGRCAVLICTPITPAFAIDTRSSVDGSACGATAFLATVNDSSATSRSRLGPHECFQSDAHSISLPKLAFVCWHCKPSTLQRRHRNYNTTHGEYTDSARG